ncbi:unnamed protein product [Brachionus calyciflorus]|uniref:Uncharacterized protein n=1 Tax=Brachionus calyciflorus TaxID=104777 RepID=A0A813VKE9_9BILA|nr:unnamed protein product [Brachionus calyciflorus]
MTLKLIDKDLKSKYAEVLYRNQVSFDKEINRRFRRLSGDYVRTSQNVDNGSQVFLNRIRQKRDKWTQDDLSFRDHYRLVCRNVTNKKLENLKNAISSNSLKKRSHFLQTDPVIESKLQILKEQLNDDESSSFRYNSEINFNYEPPRDVSKAIFIPKLPDLKNLSIDEDLYCKYSKSDRDFLEQYPGKVELTITKLGKKFVSNEEHRQKTLRKQIIRNERIQTNAIKDPRFSELIENFSNAVN